MIYFHHAACIIISIGLCAFNSWYAPPGNKLGRTFLFKNIIPINLICFLHRFVISALTHQSIDCNELVFKIACLLGTASSPESHSSS